MADYEKMYFDLFDGVTELMKLLEKALLKREETFVLTDKEIEEHNVVEYKKIPKE